jgi:hypothetical protein
MSVSETETIKETERGGPPLTSKTTRVTYRGSQTERLKQQIGRKAELASSRALSQARSYAVPKVRQELGIPDKPKPPPKPVEEPDESEEMYYKRERHPALAKGKVPKARGPYRVPAHIRERIASEREKKEQEETSGKEVSEKEKEEKPVEA